MMTHPTGHGTLQAYDQYGQPAMKEFGRTKNHAGVMKQCWPPTGYNIILHESKSFDLRIVWPGVSKSNAANLQIPSQASMEHESGTRAPAVAAAGGAGFCSECGSPLESADAKFCAKCGNKIEG
jgi:membrane protease subunit (stomatin/prohibitin family)